MVSQFKKSKQIFFMSKFCERDYLIKCFVKLRNPSQKVTKGMEAIMFILNTQNYNKLSPQHVLNWQVLIFGTKKRLH